MAKFQNKAKAAWMAVKNRFRSRGQWSTARDSDVVVLLTAVVVNDVVVVFDIAVFVNFC